MAEALDKDGLDDELLEAEGSETAEKSAAAVAAAEIGAQERDTQDKEEAFLDIATFLKKYNPAGAFRNRLDVLNERYALRPHDVLNEYSTDFSTACAASDETNSNAQIYGLILQRDMPYRLKNLEEQAQIENVNLVQLLAYGSVQLSQEEQFRQVAIFEKPSGQPMREVLEARKTPFNDRFIIEEVIAPIGQVLKQFRAAGISHGSINLDTVFLGDKLQLGECVSTPCGYGQHFHFESAERSQANPLGKGETGVVADCYALGILIAHMVLGMRFFDRIEQASFLERRLVLGTYNILLSGREYSSLEDFFKGVLHDDPAERWSPDQIEQWVGGKKFNLLTPSVLREGQRPYPFKDEDYFNRRALANALATNWEDAQTNLRTGHLSRWVEVSLHKNPMAEALRQVMERTGGINSSSERANNELVVRSIALLDPEGPVRYSRVSTFAEGLGAILASAFRRKEQATIHSVIEILDYNFFAMSKDDANDPKKQFSIKNKFPACNRYLRMLAMGFGIERVLYELNPTLPCQSPLLGQEDVLTSQDMLEAIDRLGTRKSKGFDYLDRHIAAFIASKIDITKEIKLSELKIIPALSQNPQLIVLYMLTLAQKKLGKPKLKGLSAWAALRVIPLVDNFHSRTIRRKVRGNLKSAARSGELEKIFEAINETALVAEDVHGFQKAVHRFGKNIRMIEKLQDKAKLKAKGEHIGMVLATILAFSGLAITLVAVLKDRFY